MLLNKAKLSLWQTCHIVKEVHANFLHSKVVKSTDADEVVILYFGQFQGWAC